MTEWKSKTVPLDTPVASITDATVMVREITLREPTAAMLEEIEALGVENPNLSVRLTISMISLMSDVPRDQIAKLSARDLLKIGEAAGPLLPEVAAGRIAGASPK